MVSAISTSKPYRAIQHSIHMHETKYSVPMELMSGSDCLVFADSDLQSKRNDFGIVISELAANTPLKSNPTSTFFLVLNSNR